MAGQARPYSLSTRAGRSFRFDAGALCIEFATTGGEGYRAAWETLHQPADLAAWASHSRLAASGPIDPDHLTIKTKDLVAAKALREAIWSAASKVVLGRRPRREDLALINHWAAESPMAPRLDPKGHRRTWATPITGRQLLSTIARDAIDLLAGPLSRRIRQCAGPSCSLIFVDTSRPGARRWCSMERCGNLEKQRSLRQRRQSPIQEG